LSGVSVIICCYNSAKRLPETLGHLARQEGSNGFPWEVLVVDNASTDGTGEVAGREWQRALSPAPLRVVLQPVPGLSFAREKGIESAQYEFLLFCDDDNWLCPTYLARACEILEKHPEVALVGGWGEPVCEVTPPSWFKDFSGPYGTGPQMSGAGIAPFLTTFYGAGSVIRKSDYQNLVQQGFRFFLSGRQGSKLTTGEDRELCYAFSLNGKKLYYDPALKFRHFIPKERATFAYYRQMAVNCVPAFLILQTYRLQVLKRIQSRPEWKKSYWWILGMVIVSQIRRVGTAGWFDLKKGYFRHLVLEIRLSFQTVRVWLSGWGRFRQVYQAIENARYVRL
jgi:glycosyltransferase involved in cell wall biosynthesis